MWPWAYCLCRWSLYPPMIWGQIHPRNKLFMHFFLFLPTVESSESQTVIGLDGWCAGKEETSSKWVYGRHWRETHAPSTASKQSNNCKGNAPLTLTIHEGAMPYETINSFRLVLTSKYHFFGILKGNYVVMWSTVQFASKMNSCKMVRHMNKHCKDLYFGFRVINTWNKGGTAPLK